MFKLIIFKNCYNANAIDWMPVSAVKFSEKCFYGIFVEGNFLWFFLCFFIKKKKVQCIKEIIIKTENNYI